MQQIGKIIKDDKPCDLMQQIMRILNGRTSCNTAHGICNQLLDSLLDVLNANTKNLDPRIILQLYEFLNFNMHRTCNKNILCEVVFTKLYEKIDLNFNIFLPTIIKFDQYYLLPILEKNNLINDEFIKSIIASKSVEFISLIIDKYPDHFKNKLDTIIELNNPELIEKILDTKVIPTRNNIIRAIELNMTDIVITMIKLGVVITKDLLLLACTLKNKDLIKLFLENKIVPDKACFKEIIFRKNNKHPYNNYYKTSNYKLDFKIQTELIDILVNYGYIITYEDVLLATENRIFINNIDKFNIKFDTRYTKLCTTIGIYPYDTNVSPDIECLEIECKKSGNYAQIQSMIKKFKLIPNSCCLENACSVKNNTKTLDILLKYDIAVTKKSLTNLVSPYGVRCFDILLDKVTIAQIKTEKKIVDNKDKDQIIVKDNGKVKVKDKRIKVVCSDSECEESSDEESSEEETKEIPKETVEPEKLKEPVEIKESKFSELISMPKLHICQRNLYDVNEKILKLLSCKSKKLTFIDLRKKLIEYFKNNEMFDKKEQHKIFLNESLEKILNVKNKYIDFHNLHNFVVSLFI